MNPGLFAESPGPDLTGKDSPPLRHVTQLERVERLLRRSDAVCSTTLLKEHLPRAAAHVHTLRRQGWMIQTRACSDESHVHETYQVEYALVALPFDPSGS